MKSSRRHDEGQKLLHPWDAEERASGQKKMGGTGDRLSMRQNEDSREIFSFLFEELSDQKLSLAGWGWDRWKCEVPKECLVGLEY